MSAKPHFTAAQQEIIRATAKKIWLKQFAWMKKTKKTKDQPAQPGGQEAMALALGVSQQTVSALIDPKGSYNPGYRVATAIANLDGKTLEQLVGDFGNDEEGVEEETSPQRVSTPPPTAISQFTNLDVCISFHASTKHWSAWTIAAARAGYFGMSDFPAPEWTGKLDSLEKALERARKGM